MQTLFRRALFGVLVVSPVVALAQQATSLPITPNYGRLRGMTATQPIYRPRLAWNQEAESVPDPAIPPVGSGVEEVAPKLDLGTPLTIPQQGSVQTNGPQVDNLISSDGACSACGQNDCDCADVILDTGCAHGGWFGGLYYLVLFRDDDSRGQVLAYDDLAPDTPLLSTGTTTMKEGNGVALRVGKMLNACTALEALYWQVFPDDKTGRLYSSLTPGNIASSLVFTGLEYDDTLGFLPVDNFYQGPQLLEVQRTYDYRNFELNLLRLPFLCCSNDRARLAVLGGVRYFRGDEGLRFTTDFYNDVLGDDPVNELSYHDEVENHLVGFQLGTLFDYQMTCRLSGNISGKFGVYNNHMKIKQTLVGGNGAAIINTGAFTGQPFAVTSSKDDVAFLGELDAGLAYSIGCHWRVTGGYRVMAMSGYAQAISQIPYDFTNLSSAAHVQDNDSLILHGAYVGVEYAW